IYQLIYRCFIVQSMVFKNNVLRYPRLDTVLMIEDAVRASRGDKTITEVWKKLPKKVMWQTFLTTLEYLVHSGKVFIEDDKTVTWIWNPKLLKKIRREGVEV
ncbi:MAG: hypothetical protein ABH803_04255, partial [Candidatus Micrarchaeota archaeon]